MAFHSARLPRIRFEGLGDVADYIRPWGQAEEREALGDLDLLLHRATSCVRRPGFSRSSFHGIRLSWPTALLRFSANGFANIRGFVFRFLLRLCPQPRLDHPVWFSRTTAFLFSWHMFHDIRGFLFYFLLGFRPQPRFDLPDLRQPRLRDLNSAEQERGSSARCPVRRSRALGF